MFRKLAHMFIFFLFCPFRGLATLPDTPGKDLQYRQGGAVEGNDSAFKINTLFEERFKQNIITFAKSAFDHKLIIIITLTMNEQEFDPRDLNKDGKVTLGEKIQYAAQSAVETVKESAQTVAASVKKFSDATPEERKEKTDEIKAKVNKAAGQVVDKAKEVYGEMKENAEKILAKKDEENCCAPEEPAEPECSEKAPEE